MNQEDEDFLESLQIDEVVYTDFTDETIPGVAAGIFDSITIPEGQSYVDADDPECKCPPAKAEPTENPTNQQALKDQQELAKNLTKAQSKISEAQTALNDAQTAAQTNIQIALEQFNVAQSALDTSNSRKKRVDNQSCRAADALRNLNEALVQRQGLAESMVEIADDNRSRMELFNIPLSAPAGGKGSPTLINAIRCYKSNSEGPNCAWFDSDKVNKNKAVWNAMLKDYKTWENDRKKILALNKKIKSLHRTYAAAFSVWQTLLQNAPTNKQLDGLEKSALAGWDYYTETVEQANASLKTSFETYKSAVNTYNGIAAKIVSVTSETYEQKSVLIDCPDDSQKICPTTWHVVDTITTPSAPGPLQVDPINFIDPIQQPDIQRTFSAPCHLGNFTPLPNVPPIGVGPDPVA